MRYPPTQRASTGNGGGDGLRDQGFGYGCGEVRRCNAVTTTSLRVWATGPSVHYLAGLGWASVSVSRPPIQCHLVLFRIVSVRRHFLPAIPSSPKFPTAQCLYIHIKGFFFISSNNQLRYMCISGDRYQYVYCISETLD